MDKIFLNWEQIELLVDILCKKIKTDHTIKSIYGLPRGGLIPAVMVSHKLNIPMVSVLHPHESYDTLIIDDICDTGETLLEYKKHKTACLHHKLNTKFTPTYFAEIVSNDLWISYAWENKEAKTIQDYKLK